MERGRVRGRRLSQKTKKGSVMGFSSEQTAGKLTMRREVHSENDRLHKKEKHESRRNTQKLECQV